MQINGIGNTYRPTYTVKKERGFHRQPEFDCVSFCSKSLPKSNKELNKIVESAVSDINNMIGFGGEGIVYKIPDIKYCVKVPKTNYLKDTPAEKWEFKVSPKDKVNHIIAKSKEGKVIMKYIEGENLKKIGKSDIYDLPDRSYISFIKQLENAKLNGRGIDSAPQNIIFNKKDKSLTIIDFYDKDDNIWKKINPYSAPIKDTFCTLKSKGYAPEEKENNWKLGSKLLNIVINELDKPKTDFKIDEQDTSILIEQIMLSQDYDVNIIGFETLKNAINTMIDLHKNYPENKTKLDKISELSKDIIKNELIL